MCIFGLSARVRVLVCHCRQVNAPTPFREAALGAGSPSHPIFRCLPVFTSSASNEPLAATVSPRQRAVDVGARGSSVLSPSRCVGQHLNCLPPTRE